uniref:Phosphoribosylformylglycinamidine synthase n=2 Tax=Amorphochlora amoebiformis TaxID=1561963 RepID=A0A7S0DLX5_9EUKA
MAQSNSEHSRHWFFGGKMVIDGKEKPTSLFKIVKKPYVDSKPNNSVIAFHDNSSAMHSATHPNPISVLIPTGTKDQPGKMEEKKRDWNILFTAETHNFPSGIAPFPGAETGTGGRLRDTHAAGAGSLVLAGTAAYCVGNLYIPGYELPWEDKDFKYPSNKAYPLQIMIEASNGASDYGNKFGEPVITGYARSFGMRVPKFSPKDSPAAKGEMERVEWIKPIMFTGGIGQIDNLHIAKGEAKKGMLIIKIGGPAYRIGMGGGAASSMFQGENAEALDFNAVQRGDAEMLQRVNRVIRACVELGEKNPIVAIHDQGAGGNGNVLKEISEESGAAIDLSKILCGDPSMSALELWGAEYQENDALLLEEKDLARFDAICKRENAPYSVVGKVSGDGRITVVDKNGKKPVDLDLKDVLGKLPPKTFKSNTLTANLVPLSLPTEVKINGVLDRVLRLVSVGSKRYLTNKVDRSVTGLIAQQQCVGPLHIPLSDVAIIAQSYLGKTGAATAIGEQPIKGLLSPAAMARLSVAEALSNLVWAKITDINNIKASGNWMWAAKFDGGAAAMYEAAVAMSEMMIALGIALDGGKDSLSMAANAPGEKLPVKCPGALVISAYCSMADVTIHVTPDLKRLKDGRLLLLSLSSKARMGGSSLAHVYNQLGAVSPDVEDFKAFLAMFNCVQSLLAQGLVSAGHDRSDGGLLTTILEMAFAGNTGVDIEVQASGDFTKEQLLSRGGIDFLFNEEVGLVMEVAETNMSKVLAECKKADIRCTSIGRVREDPKVTVTLAGSSVFTSDIRILRDKWEATSFQLEMRQCNPACVKSERDTLKDRKAPSYKLSYTPTPTAELSGKRHAVAIVRQEGSNGDREMLAAFHAAGFDAWDVHMNDLAAGRTNLSNFRGVVFVGGFSYADVLDSAKGWAATIKYNSKLSAQFQAFYERKDTFSLGVCNGCQLMALMGWVPEGPGKMKDTAQPRFVHNESSRFESRWTTVRIEKSPAIMFDGMEGSVLGVWVAHGEGRALFPDKKVLKAAQAANLVPMRYADDDGKATQVYPFNPNGSADAIASLCSADGRHIAMMPHPERCYLKWQWPYMPEDWRSDLKSGPWLKMFQNARKWCDTN